MGFKELFSTSSIRPRRDNAVDTTIRDRPASYKRSTSKRVSATIGRIFSIHSRRSTRSYNEQSTTQLCEKQVGTAHCEPRGTPLTEKQRPASTSSTTLQPMAPPPQIAYESKTNKLQFPGKRDSAYSPAPLATDATVIVKALPTDGSQFGVDDDGQSSAIGNHRPTSERTAQFTRLAQTRVASLPARVPSPTYDRRHLQTAEDAIKGYQRRKLIIELAYRAAIDGCKQNITVLERLDQYITNMLHPNSRDLILDFDGVHIKASQLGGPERNWIARSRAVRSIVALAERRILGRDDCEVISTQLFPSADDRLYTPECFEVFLMGLAEEDILSHDQAKQITVLGVTTEELDGGAHYTGPLRNRYSHRRDPSSLALLDIPRQPSHSIGTFAANPSRYQINDLYFFLRILSEAAVYNQAFWKGYFFANARSKIKSFHEAYTVTQQGWPLPPRLTEYKRPWSYRESRLLQRAHLVSRLLDMWEAGNLHDFGIIRAVRGTYVTIAMQCFFSLSELESFLYHRVVGSGLSFNMILELLALYPEHDAIFTDPQSRNTILTSLQDRAQNFKQEEQERISQNERSFASFQSVIKAQMTPWQRVKAKLKTFFFGRNRDIEPFDSFAPDHKL